LNAACGGRTPSDIDHRSYVTPLTAVQIRNGSSINCTAVGSAQASDDLDYYCWTSNSDGTHTWTFLRDVRTGVTGWVRDDNLRNNGSQVFCGF